MRQMLNACQLMAEKMIETIPTWFGAFWLTTTIGAIIALGAGINGIVMMALLFTCVTLYVLLALITLAVMTIDGYRCCCVATDSFARHLLHDPRRSVNLCVSLLWPYGWYWWAKIVQEMLRMDWATWAETSVQLVWDTKRNSALQ